MREIKFRAWDINNKKFNLEHGAYDTEGILINQLIDFYISRNFILMQYTGLKDKNGKEIYEGDIVKKSYPKSKPQRRSMVFAIEYKELFDNEMGYSLGIGFDFHGYGSHELEVIGNIYENPELLDDGVKVDE